MDELTTATQLRLRCEELLQLVRGGTDIDVRTILDRVAGLEARIDDMRVRGQVGLDRGVHALATGHADIAVTALTGAYAAFEQYGKAPRLVGDCLTQLARAHGFLHDDTAKINSLQEALVHYRQWAEDETKYNEFGGAAKQVETAIALHRSLIYAGRPEVGALEEERRSVDPDLWIDRPDLSAQIDAHIDLLRAEAHAARGNYQGAEDTLVRLAPLDDTLRADVLATRGFVLASSGRAAEALGPYTDAADIYTAAVSRLHREHQATHGTGGVRDVDELHTARTVLATCLMNRGAVRGSTKDHRRAIDDYTGALRELEQVPFGGVSAARCQLNIATELLQDGDYQGTARMLRAIEPILETIPASNVLHAGYLETSAHLLSSRQLYLESAEHHRQARNSFRSAGRPEWAARAGINVAASSALADRGDEHPAGYAARELIPALLYLDQMRFQFPTVAGRTAWRDTVAGATQLAFELADGDPTLVSELIEHAINSGTHSATPVPVNTEGALELRERIGAVGQPMSATDASVGDRDFGSGASCLVAGAVLPMHPPPRLVMPGPDRKVALQGYFELAEIEYGEPLFRSTHVVHAYG
ncbi:MAG: hypothetical protein V7697_28950 [Rhodococcus erythropolis]